MKHWCVKHNQACGYANSNGDCKVSACQTVIGGDRKMTNREWLQTLTDEEFVRLMCYSCESCTGHTDLVKCNNMLCRDGHIEWLKQEHEQEDCKDGKL